MAMTPVPRMRTVIENSPRGLQFTVPAKRPWFAMLFLPVWLVGWLLAEVTVGAQLLSGGTSGFLLVWLILWTFGGAFCIMLLLWMATGNERITVGRGVIAHRFEILGVGRTREYDLTHIRNLVVAPESLNMWNGGAGLRFYGVGGGPIAFDYGAKTIRMAAALDEAEGRMVVKKIKENVRIPE